MALGLTNGDPPDVPPGGRFPAEPQAVPDEPHPRVAAAWKRTQPADGTPFATYLVGRGIWPGDESGGYKKFIERGGHWPALGRLPASLGWVPATAQLDAGNNVALPDAAAGWGTYAFQRSGSPVVFGVHIEAITATGARAEIAFKGKRLRRLSIPGSRFPSAVVFTARSGRGLVHVTESEPDAIALLALEHLGVADLHGGSVVAAHCAGGLATAVVGPGEAVMLWPQRDANYAGQTAALKARKALEGSSGRLVRINWGVVGQDWADLAWRRGRLTA